MRRQEEGGQGRRRKEEGGRGRRREEGPGWSVREGAGGRGGKWGSRDVDQKLLDYVLCLVLSGSCFQSGPLGVLLPVWTPAAWRVLLQRSPEARKRKNTAKHITKRPKAYTLDPRGHRDLAQDPFKSALGPLLGYTLASYSSRVQPL